MTRGERPVVTWAEWLGATEGDLDLRLDLGLWRSIIDWVFDFDSGEQAGALLIRTDAVRDGAVVVGERFVPVTEEYVLDRGHGLRFDGRFNLRVAEAAERRGAARSSFTRTHSRTRLSLRRKMPPSASTSSRSCDADGRTMCMDCWC